VAIDFSSYNPPGVYSNPITGPQLAVNSALPRAVGLVGTTVGYRTYIETIKIEADTVANTTPAPSATLAKAGINLATLKVFNLDTGTEYTLGTHYTVVATSGSVSGSSTAKYFIRRVVPTPANGISQLQSVRISYQYTDPAYYAPTSFYDYSDVVAAYGDPYKVNNTDLGYEIQSELTLGAKFAFLNGASSVVCAAVNKAGEIATSGEYNTALAQLEDEPTVAVVVPCNGNIPALHSLVKQHVTKQSESRFERRAIVGVDGSTSTVPHTQRLIYASGEGVGILDRRVALVSPSAFVHFSDELNKYINLGGQFMAASLAGMTVKMSFAQPLTHKNITGWTGISDGDIADYSATNSTKSRDSKMSTESNNGLCVIETTRRRAIRVRHGVSTAIQGGLLAREWSITGQEDALVYRLRDYLDDANLIGQPIYNYTLVNVKASAEAALQSLIRDGLLVDYTGLAVRQLLTNPDVLEISFGWKPAFPLNYIVLTFSVSLSSGDINNNAANANARNVTAATQITTPNITSINDFGGPSNTLNSV